MAKHKVKRKRTVKLWVSRVAWGAFNEHCWKAKDGWITIEGDRLFKTRVGAWRAGCRWLAEHFPGYEIIEK